MRWKSCELWWVEVGGKYWARRVGGARWVPSRAHGPPATALIHFEYPTMPHPTLHRPQEVREGPSCGGARAQARHWLISWSVGAFGTRSSVRTDYTRRRQMMDITANHQAGRELFRHVYKMGRYSAKAIVNYIYYEAKITQLAEQHVPRYTRPSCIQTAVSGAHNGQAACLCAALGRGAS